MSFYEKALIAVIRNERRCVRVSKANWPERKLLPRAYSQCARSQRWDLPAIPSTNLQTSYLSLLHCEQSFDDGLKFFRVVEAKEYTRNLAFAV